MTTPTDLQLKIALAKELPELLHNVIGQNRFWWRDTCDDVTDREWDWVVNQLYQRLAKDDAESPEHEQPMWFLSLQYQLRYLTNSEEYVYATWQQRAIAYFAAIGKEIV